MMQLASVRTLARIAFGWVMVGCLGIPVTARAADEGEVLTSAPVAYKTYTFTPGKLTGKKFWLEDIEKKEKVLWREFSFEQFLTYKKPEETVPVRLSLRGGYRPHDLFGHDDFEPKEAESVATGWVPRSSGHFLIYPDQSKEHLPKWVPERTKLIRVPLIKQYGDTAVNAYDLALGLDRVNKGELKTIEFQLIPITDDAGKKCVRLVPTISLVAGVYLAYSLPDGTDTAIYGFLFVVGSPAPGSGVSQVVSGETTSFLRFPIKSETDPWAAKISALMDHDLQKDGKLKTFQGEGDNVTHVPGDKPGDDYFVKTDGEEFNLGELSHYQDSKKDPKNKFYYDGHRGYDYPYISTEEIIAADGGVLDVSEMEKSKAWHAIVIKHDNGFVTYYLHLSKWSPAIEEHFRDTAKQKSRIQKGEIIGYPGGWGPDKDDPTKDDPNRYGVHLHFRVHDKDDKVVDPYGEFTKDGVSVAPILWSELPPSQRRAASTSKDLRAVPNQAPFQQNICLLPDVQLARDVLDYALLSEAVYKEKTIPNWELLVTDTCPINGMICWKNIEETSFQVQVYRLKGGNKLAVAFRGTELTKLGDWKADVQNFFNGVPKQYEQAVDFVKQVTDKVGSDYEIVLTGHSLGGGLASYAALRLRKTAIVFNAAGLGKGLRDKIPSENLELQKTFVRNINLIGDPVSGLGGQAGTIYALKPPASLIGRVGLFVDNRSQMVGPIFALHPEAAGEAQAVSINPLDYHFIAAFIETLRALAK